MTDLKPCPFCASNNLRIPKNFNFQVDGHLRGTPSDVCCTDCGGSGPGCAYVDDVVLAWNTRIDYEKRLKDLENATSKE